MARSTDPQTAAESNQSIGTAIIMPHPTEAVDVQLSEYAVAEAHAKCCTCDHDSRFVTETNACLVCALRNLERENYRLRQDLEASSDRLASVEAEFAVEQATTHTFARDLSRCREQITSLEESVESYEVDMQRMSETNEDLIQGHRGRAEHFENMVAVLQTDVDHIQQLLKDTQTENDHLRLQLEHSDRQARARLEGNKGKIRFLEQENETLVSERLVLKQRCENLDSQLASVTLSLETASVKAVNLEWQLQDATQKWEEERRDKDSDIQALTEMLAGLQTSSARSTMAGLPSSPANRPQRAMDTPWPTSSWVPPHATWAPDFPTSPVSPSSRSSEPPLSPLISPDFAPLMTCDYLDKTTVPAPTSHPQTTPRNTPQSLNISFTQPIYGAGDAISHAGTPEAPSAYRCSAGQCAPDVAGKLPGAAVISGPPQSSKHDFAQGVASASHISPDADLVSADRYNPHRRRSFLRYPHAPVKADMDSQSPNEPVANGSHSVQALGDSARVAPPGTSVGDAPQHQFYTFMRFVADTLYPLLFHLVGEAFTAKVRKIERTFSRRPPVVAVAAAAIIATVANGPETIISRCGVLLVSVTLSTSTTYSPSLIARLCFTHVKKWRLAVAGFVPLLFMDVSDAVRRRRVLLAMLAVLWVCGTIVTVVVATRGAGPCACYIAAWRRANGLANPVRSTVAWTGAGKFLCRIVPQLRVESRDQAMSCLSPLYSLS